MRNTRPLAIAVAVLAAAGCSATADDTAGAGAGATREPTTPATSMPSGDGASPDDAADDGNVQPPPTPTDAGTATASPSEPPHPVSLPAMMEQDYDGGDLEVGELLEETGSYTRHQITYRSGELTVSGIMNVPAGDGPFPVLILAHGYIDPDIYTTGRGLAREQDYLARQGYAVLHTDYRNHAGSDDDPQNEVRMRLGYTEDVVNAVVAVRESSLPYLDGERVGLLGRSMGGGVALNALVVQPGLVDAAVIYASVSSDAVENFDQWIRGNPERSDLAAEIMDQYGAPEENPEFWRNVSPVTFFDRVSEPVLIHHGTADETCPIEWAYDTYDALAELDKDVTLEVYEGERHAFEPRWQDSIERTAEFFDEHL